MEKAFARKKSFQAKAFCFKIGQPIIEYSNTQNGGFE